MAARSNCVTTTSPTTRPLAKMHVFDRAPGLVARCLGCDDVVVRVVYTSDRV